MGFGSGNIIRTILLFLVTISPVSGVELVEPLINRADKGDVVAMYQAAVKLLDTGSTSESGKVLKYLETVSADEQSEFRYKANIWLGRIYRDSLAGVAKDLKKSFEYFELAAGKQGKDPEAQYELGKAYLNGIGTDRNLIAAYMWTALSLRKSSPVQAEAKQQEKLVAGMLNKVQLEKALLLVDQLESLYLNL